MTFDQNFQSKLQNDVLSHRFSDSDELVYYVQTRIGKLDSSIVTSYWLGRDHTIHNDLAGAEYIQCECNR